VARLDCAVSALAFAIRTQRAPVLVHTSIQPVGPFAAAKARDTVGAMAPNSIATQASQTQRLAVDRKVVIRCLRA